MLSSERGSGHHRSLFAFSETRGASKMPSYSQMEVRRTSASRPLPIQYCSLCIHHLLRANDPQLDRGLVTYPIPTTALVAAIATP